MDLGVGQGGRHSMERKLFRLVGSKGQTFGPREQTSFQASKNLGTRVGMGATRSQGKTGQAKSPFEQLRQIAQPRPKTGRGKIGNLYPQWAKIGHQCDRGQGSKQS